jgi:hypothetical protein
VLVIDSARDKFQVLTQQQSAHFSAKHQKTCCCFLAERQRKQLNLSWTGLKHSLDSTQDNHYLTPTRLHIEKMKREEKALVAGGTASF